ncbi:MAG: hypothetical protein F4047_06975 [Caldilineaceae bacterium SB0670_bin_27]|uniref:Uncharacterized protein n=1 Tax=Caldilineaceae bacterium SB0664_bin_27 TaxID=2605260 RepID=A0A6B0Z027_9CHLR|nr:hypothetical protein [Caldilineaceae bacterium SB0664_bin_27]MYJ77884.1 hypothetical protein [Caldilineaceae bacterium SB0670_bin_27]
MEANPSELTAAATFDAKRAILSKRDMFRPLAVQRTEGLAGALSSKKVRAETPLLVLDRNGAALSLLTSEMIFHHVAQGEWNGAPFLATF